MIALRNQQFSQANSYLRPGGDAAYQEFGGSANLKSSNGYYMSDITATSFTVGNATSNRQGDTYVAHIFGGKPANTLAEGETYPVVYGTYNGTSGAGLFIPTGGTKPQFHYCKMLVATSTTLLQLVIIGLNQTSIHKLLIHTTAVGQITPKLASKIKLIGMRQILIYSIIILSGMLHKVSISTT